MAILLAYVSHLYQGPLRGTSAPGEGAKRSIPVDFGDEAVPVLQATGAWRPLHLWL